MKQISHLQMFDLVLEAKSPVFIGCGKESMKKDYIYDSQRQTVSFLDEEKFFAYLVEHDLVNEYEAFMLSSRNDRLFSFLKNSCGIPQSDINKLIRYTVDSGDALDAVHSTKGIQRFVRNSLGQAYVPGSSVKGALRTVILKDMLLQCPYAIDTAERKGAEDILKTGDRKSISRYFSQVSDSIEEKYFHTLSLKPGKQGNALNSILQGLRISDSQPIPDQQLCLTRKVDDLPNGDYHSINICRESLKPGTLIRCTMTLDQSILKGAITKESIEKAIAAASGHYEESVLAYYPKVESDMNSKTILLGGGVGFQSKTVIDPYYGESAPQITMGILNQNFSKHHHERDIRTHGISPRCLKSTDYDGYAFPYGVCEVTFS